MSGGADRREFLRAATAAGITGGLAGCSGDGSGSESPGTQDGTNTGTEAEQGYDNENSNNNETEESGPKQSLDSEEIHRMLGDHLPSFGTALDQTPRTSDMNPINLYEITSGDVDEFGREAGSIEPLGAALLSSGPIIYRVRLFPETEERVSDALGVQSGETTHDENIGQDKVHLLKDRGKNTVHAELYPEDFVDDNLEAWKNSLRNGGIDKSNSQVTSFYREIMTGTRKPEEIPDEIWDPETEKLSGYIDPWGPEEGTISGGKVDIGGLNEKGEYRVRAIFREKKNKDGVDVSLDALDVGYV